jgi:hypothetical protein
LGKTRFWKSSNEPKMLKGQRQNVKKSHNIKITKVDKDLKINFEKAKHGGKRLKLKN